MWDRRLEWRGGKERWGQETPCLDNLVLENMPSQRRKITFNLLCQAQQLNQNLLNTTLKQMPLAVWCYAIGDFKTYLPKKKLKKNKNVMTRGKKNLLAIPTLGTDFRNNKVYPKVE